MTSTQFLTFCSGSEVICSLAVQEVRQHLSFALDRDQTSAGQLESFRFENLLNLLSHLMRGETCWLSSNQMIHWSLKLIISIYIKLFTSSPTLRINIEHSRTFQSFLTWILPITPVESILLATFTALPQISYWGFLAPMTPATIGPMLIPILILKLLKECSLT